MQVEADFFATCLYLPASLGTTAFVLPCVADADPISFPELDLSENESKTLQLCILWLELAMGGLWYVNFNYRCKLLLSDSAVWKGWPQVEVSTL